MLFVNICRLQIKYLSTAGKLNGMDHPPACLQSGKSYGICHTNFKLFPLKTFITLKKIPAIVAQVEVGSYALMNVLGSNLMGLAEMNKQFRILELAERPA